MPKKTRKDYPANWEEIAARVKANARYMCEECKLQFPVGENVLYVFGKKLVLTVHHRDRNPMNNNPENLVALCSRCHCRAEWPLIRRELRERRNKNQLSLF